jgi:hypothetical protein
MFKMHPVDFIFILFFCLVGFLIGGGHGALIGLTVALGILLFSAFFL